MTDPHGCCIVVFVTAAVFLGWLVVPSVVFVLSHSLSFVFLGVLPVLPPPASLLSLCLSLLLLPIIVVHCGVCVHVVPLCCSRCLWFVVHSFPLSRE